MPPLSPHSYRASGDRDEISMGLMPTAVGETQAYSLYVTQTYSLYEAGDKYSAPMVDQLASKNVEGPVEEQQKV